LPPWIDREHRGWLTPEIVHQLAAKEGTEAQTQEKLEIILYNETQGPVERHVRERRAVLAYYLRTPQADFGLTMMASRPSPFGVPGRIALRYFTCRLTMVVLCSVL